MELRRGAEAALGQAFDLRDFHEVLLTTSSPPSSPPLPPLPQVVLRAAGPLHLLQRKVEEYIRRKQAA